MALAFAPSEAVSCCAAATQDQVARKVCLSEKALTDAIDNIRGAVMICYPMGLPEWDLIRENLEDKEELSGTSVSG